MGKKYSQLTLKKRIEIQMLLQGGWSQVICRDREESGRIPYHSGKGDKVTCDCCYGKAAKGWAAMHEEQGGMPVSDMNPECWT